MTDNEEMQDSGIEWIGAIPQGWKVERLKKVSTIKSSNVDKKDYPDQIPVRLCNYVDVYYNDVIDSSIKFMKSTASDLEYKKFHLSAGDVVLTKDSETPDDIAVPAYVAENIDDLVCGYHLAVMQANHKLDGKFLFRAIQSTGIKEQFYRLATGITRFGLKIHELESVLIPLPPLLEQRAIAQYLDQHCGKLDAIIAIKQRQIKALDVLRQSIIYHAVTKGLDDSVPLVDSGVEWLGNIPQGWKQYRIKDVAELSPNYSKNNPDPDELCTVIPMEKVTVKGDIDVSNLEQYENITKGLTSFENGDVIFAKITPCMENGKGAYVTNLPTRYAFGSTEFHVLRSGYKLNGKFLYYYTYNRAFRDYAALNMTGAAGQKRVSTNFLKYTIIYLPDISEQQCIAGHLDQENQRLNDLKENLSQQISTLQAYKKALIYECVTGKKRINADVLKAG